MIAMSTNGIWLILSENARSGTLLTIIVQPMLWERSCQPPLPGGVTPTAVAFRLRTADGASCFAGARMRAANCREKWRVKAEHATVRAD
jgi:hypothetical protein